DAAYLFPYLLTGVRAHLAHNEADAAQAWADRVTAVLTARAIPGTLPAIGHARGLVLLARGDVSAAHRALEAASGAWRARHPVWGGRLGPARPRARRRPGPSPRRGGAAHQRGPRPRGRRRRRRPGRCGRPADRLVRPRAGGRSVVPAERARVRGGPARRG